MKALDDMSMEELRALNEEVVARMRALHANKSRDLLSNFRIGQIVQFRANKGPWSPLLTARIDALNQKTASVTVIDTGKKWRVHPSFLQAVKEAQPA